MHWLIIYFFVNYEQSYMCIFNFIFNSQLITMFMFLQPAPGWVNVGSVCFPFFFFFRFWWMALNSGYSTWNIQQSFAEMLIVICSVCGSPNGKRYLSNVMHHPAETTFHLLCVCVIHKHIHHFRSIKNPSPSFHIYFFVCLFCSLSSMSIAVIEYLKCL